MENACLEELKFSNYKLWESGLKIIYLKAVVQIFLPMMLHNYFSEKKPVLIQTTWLHCCLSWIHVSCVCILQVHLGLRIHTKPAAHCEVCLCKPLVMPMEKKSALRTLNVKLLSHRFLNSSFLCVKIEKIHKIIGQNSLLHMLLFESQLLQLIKVCCNWVFTFVLSLEVTDLSMWCVNDDIFLLHWLMQQTALIVFKIWSSKI